MQNFINNELKNYTFEPIRTYFHVTVIGLAL